MAAAVPFGPVSAGVYQLASRKFFAFFCEKQASEAFVARAPLEIFSLPQVVRLASRPFLVILHNR